ncbi:hypothetical protein [Actinomycetospora straminea]|uniref:Uncharacterized protein n=1 Tax=Actinomycetospora straminea TaxID=663607 RepID=A0ABP9ED62_9PSEU|nr:hypothetical protein [Actinomycetospora straminea]MDD7934421.1 hypothetical protein [Actinomycetospora straminea]
MDSRRLPVLAGPVLAGLLVLGGCAGAPDPAPTTAPAAAPAPVAAAAPAGNAQAPCTARLRPGATGGTPLTLTPEARAEIERLRAQPGPQTGQAPDPALASRLADISERVERAARPCVDR